MSSQTSSFNPPESPFLPALSFNGTDGEDVTEFVREVKRAALSQGRQRDQEWMFDYAESCLGGAAIRWFTQLDAESLTSWNTLRQALLDRFGLLEDYFIPQPPAAAIPRERTKVATSQASTISSDTAFVEASNTGDIDFPSPQLSSASAPMTPATTVLSPTTVVVPVSSLSTGDSPLDEAINSSLEGRRHRIRIESADGSLIGYCRVRHTGKLCEMVCDTKLPSKATVFVLSASGSTSETAILIFEDPVYPFSVPVFLGILTYPYRQWDCWKLELCKEDPVDHNIISFNDVKHHEQRTSKDVWTLTTRNELLLTWKDKTKLQDDATSFQIRAVSNHELRILEMVSWTPPLSRMFFEPV